MSEAGKYTNGFNQSVVLPVLMGRMGWRQSTIQKYALLDATNQGSTTGRYFNDFHALCKISNLLDSQEDKDISTDDFNTYLQSLQQSVIMRCLNSVFQEPDYLEQVLLYERNTRVQASVNNAGLFVGYEIDVAKSFDVAVQIDSATLYFDQDITFPLHLFKDGKKTPIWSQVVTVNAFENTVVDFPDLVLNYIGAQTKGSVYYFGYFQADLGSARAIREQVEQWNQTMCMRIGAFTAPQTDTLAFNSSTRYITNLPYGMNLEMSSFRDHTQMIIKKANVFDNAVGLQMVYSVLEQVLYSTRINEKERILKDGLGAMGLMLELRGAIPASDVARTTGLQTKIDAEYARVSKTFYPKQRGQTVNMAGVCSY
ncbi:MAG: hypothetical protein Q8943_17420 [Bacteroidota bacterium]|nr:hypothetical protein [Bacteroidota bacterium]